MPRNGSGVYSLPAGSIVTDGVDDILASQHNDPLQDLESDMNSARPVVAGGTGADNAADARANLGLGVVSEFYATAGGTVDAITLTTASSVPTLTAGMKFQFNPPGNNTGAVTINLNGLGAQAVQTLTGSALPANYLIARTTVVWSGSNWLVVDRPPNRSSNVNGSWTRFADGTQICRHTVTTSGGTVTWTFPQAFTAAPTVTATPISSGASRNATLGTISSTTAAVYGWVVAGTAWDGDVAVTAIGTWF